MTWQLNRFVILPVFAIYPTAQTNTILRLYNELQFFCRIPLLVALIVFYLYTGLAFIDVYNLRPEHVSEDGNGNLWIVKPREKTNNICNIPLLSIPKQILEKYKDNPYCMDKGTLLPVPCNQKMNSYRAPVKVA